MSFDVLTRHEILQELHKCGPVTTIVKGEPYGHDRDQTVVWLDLQACTDTYIFGECIINTRKTHAYVYWKHVIRLEVTPGNTYYTPAKRKADKLGWRVLQGGREG